jgi:glycosyltransferase involved in cell wall biosynthesis
MKRVLLISFQYPPMTGTSGIQRALRFSQYLPEFGWEPIVLTANARAYERTDDDQLRDVPPGMPIGRAFALDCAKHLAIFGRYPKAFAMPDRWATWARWAVPMGIRLIERYRPSAIWSTFPIPTAHRIGLSLHRHTSLPWIADFRDVMTEEGYPADQEVARCWRTLEKESVEHSARAVFTTRGAASLYAQRYPKLSDDRFAVIENGYDEQVFSGVSALTGGDSKHDGPIRILHSGVVYPSERDPTQLFGALCDLRARGALDATRFRLVLRASGHDRHLRSLAEGMGVADLVELAPPLPYRDALREMLQADALLVLQAANCNRQIPAKLYEYLRSRRPILGLADGDTASALRGAGIDAVVPLESRGEIVDALGTFLDLLGKGRAKVATEEAIRTHSRRAKTQELAQLLDDVCS